MPIWERRVREVHGQVGAPRAQRGRKGPPPLREHERPGTFCFLEAPGIFLNVRGYKNYRVCLALTFSLNNYFIIIHTIKIHCFKVYNPVTLSICSESCYHHPCQISEYLHHPKKKPPPVSSHTLPHSRKTPAPGNQ